MQTRPINDAADKTTPLQIHFTKVRHIEPNGTTGYIQYILAEFSLAGETEDTSPIIGFLQGYKILLTEAKANGVGYTDIFEPQTSIFELGAAIISDAAEYRLQPIIEQFVGDVKNGSDLLVLDGFEVLPAFNEQFDSAELLETVIRQLSFGCQLLVAKSGYGLPKETQELLMQKFGFVELPGVSLPLLFGRPFSSGFIPEEHITTPPVLHSAATRSLANRRAFQKLFSKLHVRIKL